MDIPNGHPFSAKSQFHQAGRQRAGFSMTKASDLLARELDYSPPDKSGNVRPCAHLSALGS
jgi:hypothetical protein